MVKGLSPNSLSSLFPQSVGTMSTYSHRGSQHYRIPQCRSELYKKYFLTAVINNWIQLPVEIRNEGSYPVLKLILIGINPVRISCTL